MSGNPTSIGKMSLNNFFTELLCILLRCAKKKHMHKATAMPKDIALTTHSTQPKWWVPPPCLEKAFAALTTDIEKLSDKCIKTDFCK